MTPVAAETPGRAEVASIARSAARPGRLLIVADFDGTLAEGSRDPGATTIVPLARRALRRLAAVAEERPSRVSVAVLTGRTVADVAGRIRVGGIAYLGDHGLQSGSFKRGGAPASIVTTFRAGHEASQAPAAILAERVPEVLGRPAWLYVERKGPSVAFHVRQAEDRVAARAAVETAIATVDRELPAHDLAHYRGRLVVDLRPRTAGGKREAFEELLASDSALHGHRVRGRRQRRRRVRCVARRSGRRGRRRTRRRGGRAARDAG